jgi:hypothetical protein
MQFYHRILFRSHHSFQAVSTGALPWVFIFPDINSVMLCLDTFLLKLQILTNCLYEHHPSPPIPCLEYSWMPKSISLKIFYHKHQGQNRRFFLGFCGNEHMYEIVGGLRATLLSAVKTLATGNGVAYTHINPQYFIHDVVSWRSFMS